MKKEYLEEITSLAKAAAIKEEVPVGAIIVKDNKIIGKGQNQQYRAGIIYKHAEINAIKDACMKVGRHDLAGATIIVTLEPCLMCLGAIMEARIKKLVYVLESPKYGFSRLVEKKEVAKKIIIKKGNHSAELETIMKKFFQAKR